MHEDFLHFIYKNRLWTKGTELLTDNTPFEIIDTGLHNHDSGPDFFNAKIKIDGIVWVGNVEIHVNASDWHKHHHDGDHAYDNVILHVVYNSDCDITLPNGRTLPTWEISFPQTIFNRYSDFKLNEKPIACADYIDLVDNIHISMWMEKMAVERLEHKSEHISEILNLTNGNWNETLYIVLARNFGFGTNALPFEQLAMHTPLNVMLHNTDNLFTLEAIAFGQAGMLERQPNDEYTKKLADEYHFQQKKYNLTPIPESMWKRSKMHPVNSPETRLAQFAAIMQKFQLLADRILNNRFDRNIFDNLKLSDYWKTHFSLGKLSAKEKETKIGMQTIDKILINTVIPFSYLYGKTTNPNFDSEKTIDMMRSIKAEDNRETRAFAEIGKIACDNALDSQAMLYLKKNYCDAKRCLNCNIGFQIMKEINKI
ncbi:MAG: DUF2851 family protein [Bacteroidales bacterium]|nr:DUF2851 family protein [Bacteroidales bacterium]